MQVLILFILVPLCLAGQLQSDARVLDTPGLHNVLRISDKLLSGSVPQGDLGFQTLLKLGVKTIISVDGAKPDVERARKHGMRYVHLPIGYDGVPAEQGLRIAKAVRDLPGQVYLHCHHGKHRGPAAAVVVKLCLEEKCTVATAIGLLKQAGTDPKYLGLYGAPQAWVRPQTATLDQVKSDFPETAPVTGLMQSMVEIDRRWDHLKLIKAAGWIAPKDHPDLDPPHEALLLTEHYAEAGRALVAHKTTTEFRSMLQHAESQSRQLHTKLQASGRQTSELDQVYRRVESSCLQCHAKYRDVPQMK